MDLLLVMGTSLSVAPVALIPQFVAKYRNDKCYKVLINKDFVGLCGSTIRRNHFSKSDDDSRQDSENEMSSNSDYEGNSCDDDSETTDAHSIWDQFVQGDCDESVISLCRYLGWENQLLELNRKTSIPNIT